MLKGHPRWLSPGRRALSFALALALALQSVPLSPAVARGAGSEPTATSEGAAPAPGADETGAASAPAPAEAPSAPVLAPELKAPAADPTEITELWVDGTAGSDEKSGASEGEALKTIARALELQKANDKIVTINIKGTFDAASSKAAIPAGVTLLVADDVTMTGAGAAGITLQSGSALQCKAGATLTMSGFGTALTVGDGAVVRDGSYVLDGNAIGFAVQGSGRISGSSREALKVSALNSSGGAFAYASASRFSGCTIDVQAKNEGSEQYAALYLTDASLTTRGVWYYFNPGAGVHLDHADFYAYKATGSPAYKQVMAILADSDLKNGSTLTGDGSRITLSAHLTVDDSKVVIKNSTVGGLNINYKPAEAVFNNSTLETTNMSWTPSYGTGQSDGPCHLTFKGSSVVNTDAKDKTADDGGANRNTGSTYVVTGGSFLVAYDPSFNHDVTTPTNGAENGDEWLSLLTLADSSTMVVNPINKNGVRYEYQVANASKDGLKHVWVPAAKVTFKLNNSNASFADGSVESKTQSTVRGYRLGFVTGTADPGTPSDSKGVAFLGWFYKDASGQEHEFSFADTQFDADTEVYAKWDSKTVIYHNGAGAEFIDSISASSDTAQVRSFDSIVAEKSDFSVAGKTFANWSTAPDGSGNKPEAGDVLTFAAGVTQLDLYAQYTNNEYRVAFSANGGSFGDDSVFKKNPEVFAIEKDKSGGEVAVLKQRATYGKKLRELLGSVDHNGIDPKNASASKLASLLSDAYNWYSSPDGTGKLRFSDYKRFGIFPVSGEDPAINADTTYYLKWKDDPAIKTISADAVLDADMWGESLDVTNQLMYKRVGREFSLTGAVDTAKIREQMKAIEAQFNKSTDEELEQIALSDLKSSFTATITLPAGVVVPSNPVVDVKGLGKLFSVESTKVEGQKVTIAFRLADGITNYKQLKDAVASTGQPADRSVSPLDLSSFITATVSGLKLDDSVQNDQKLTATGEVSGNFFAIAKDDASIKRFKFNWTADQLDAAEDPEGKAIQQTIVAVRPLELTLPADLEADGDTEHVAVREAFLGDSLNFTGVVDVSGIKRQMSLIEQQFGKTTDEDFEKISLSELSSSFTATFTLPEGMSFGTIPTKDNVKLEGFEDTFAVGDVTVDGKKLTVKMGLKDGIENYKQLKDAVSSVSDQMRLTVPDVKVDDDGQPGKQLTVVGTIEGGFDSNASFEGGTKRVFSFAWKGVQTDAGRDAILRDGDPSVQLTIKTVGTMDAELQGDMLVGTNTEHDSVIKQEKGSSFDLTGAVNVASVKRQMEAIEALYPSVRHEDISLDIRDFSFTASFTVPEGIELPTDLDATKVRAEAFGNGFKVSGVKVEGRTVTVTFELVDPASIDTYDKLEKVVDATGDAGETDPSWMRLTIPGLKVSAEAEAGKQLTIVGDVQGSFMSYARVPSGKSKAFSFAWTGTQWAEGRDAVATDDATIQLTIEPTEKPGTDGGTTIVTTVIRRVKSKLPQTSDDTVSALVPAGIAGIAVALVGIAVFLRHRNSR
ncbi:hypothetical protein [Olsenella urininfantis]|uniref:hypothetical protein n=1 Tax=Olsenella urininfantis TaxID=1871033 RepID=UPI000984DD2A|nr:hypothetical protein [Olsenella urininfantis]